MCGYNDVKSHGKDTKNRHSLLSLNLSCTGLDPFSTELIAYSSFKYKREILISHHYYSGNEEKYGS